MMLAIRALHKQVQQSRDAVRTSQINVRTAEQKTT